MFEELGPVLSADQGALGQSAGPAFQESNLAKSHLLLLLEFPRGPQLFSSELLKMPTETLETTGFQQVGCLNHGV